MRTAIGWKAWRDSSLKCALLASALAGTAFLVACGGGSGSAPAPPIATAGGAPPGTSPSPTPVPTASSAPTSTTYSVPAGIQHITFSSDGKLWYTADSTLTGDASTVGFLNPATGSVTSFNALTASESPYLMENELAAGANGSVWYILNWLGAGCPSPGGGQPCTQAPSMVNQVTEAGAVTAYSAGTVTNANLNDLALGADGNVYVGAWYGQSPNVYGAVLKIVPGQTGGPAAIDAVPQSTSADPTTLAPGPNGTLGVVEEFGGPSTPSTVDSFAAGSFTQIGSVADPGVFGIAFTSSTSTYWLWQAYFTITNSSGPGTGYWTSQIDRMTTGGATSSYPMPSSGEVTTSLHGQGNDQIAVAPNGSIYYSEGNAEKIARFNPSTGVTTEYPIASDVIGLAIDGTGNIWVASRNGQITKVSSF